MSDNPFLRRVAAKGSSGHGSRSERRVAKSLSARLTPASGAMRGAKADMRISAKTKWLVEAKSTTGKTLSVELAWLVKVLTEALSAGSRPALTVSFVNPDGSKRACDWVMLPLADFQELTE